jgi:hypothetical protein
MATWEGFIGLAIVGGLGYVLWKNRTKQPPSLSGELNNQELAAWASKFFTAEEHKAIDDIARAERSRFCREVLALIDKSAAKLPDDADLDYVTRHSALKLAKAGAARGVGMYAAHLEWVQEHFNSITHVQFKKMAQWDIVP